MTNRYVPNEPACPVELELLGLILRSTEARVIEIVDGQAEAQRAALATFCFQRSHMRSIAIIIAARCSEKALLLAGGLNGELLFEESRSEAPKAALRKKVTLARAA